mmetsp:Transcript_105463/g.308345  ORF Transcript_105463/g.308345 Transcript_105463/m.308345 type:complete len:213 (+) Transcript_105463:342-980(+)
MPLRAPDAALGAPARGQRGARAAGAGGAAAAAEGAARGDLLHRVLGVAAPRLLERRGGPPGLADLGAPVAEGRRQGAQRPPPRRERAAHAREHPPAAGVAAGGRGAGEAGRGPWPVLPAPPLLRARGRERAVPRGLGDRRHDLRPCAGKVRGRRRRGQDHLHLLAGLLQVLYALPLASAQAAGARPRAERVLALVSGGAAQLDRGRRAPALF